MEKIVFNFIVSLKVLFACTENQAWKSAQYKGEIKHYKLNN